MRNLRVRTLAVGYLILLSCCGCVNAAETVSADWPQYRGPTRDGVVPAGPKLLDAWPKEGPKQLWKSAPLWPDKAGKAGCASLSIANGKLYTFAYIRRKADKVVLSTSDMADWGWMDGVPDELVKKVDEERQHGKRPNLKEGPELDAYVTQYVSALDAETAKKFGPWVERRLKDPKTWNVPWDAMTRLAPLRDKESSIEELDGRAAIGASGWSNPVRSFMTDKVFKIFDTVICLDAATGKELWRKEFPGGPVHQVLDIGPSSTPAIADGKCYVAGSAGMYCLSAADGAVVWQVKTKFSNSSPLVLDGGVYVLTPEATGYDAKTGKVLWTHPDLKHTDTSFTSWNSGDKKFLLVSFEGNAYSKPPGALFCLDPADGKVVWTSPTGSGSIPVLNGNDTLIAYNWGSVRALKLSPTKADMMWEAKDVGAPRGASALVFQDHVYLAGFCHSGDALSCLDAKTGEKKWNPHKFCAESASPVLADGKIIALPETDELNLYVVMYKATPDGYQELGRFDPHAGPGASPTVLNGKLFLRLQEGIACYDLEQYGPYVDKTNVAKTGVTFTFKQADGGLMASGGDVQGLTFSDGADAAEALKTTLNGAALTVDLHGATFPLKIAYNGVGNLSAKGEPAAAFEWASPRLQFQRCNGNTVTLKLDRSVDAEVWKAESSYAIAGAKVTKVELDKTDNSIRLTTDKVWKTGDKAVLKYPAAAELPGVQAELTFTSVPGEAVGEGYLKEFLIGDTREKIDPAKAFEADTVDPKSRPAAGEKWKLCKDEGGMFDLNKHVAPLSNALTHACTYIFSNTDCKVQLWAGSDDGVQIVVNGKTVHTNATVRGCVPDSDKVKDVELKQGWNTVLLRISQGSGGWGFCLRLRNSAGDAPPTGLRYAAELPREK